MPKQLMKVQEFDRSSILDVWLDGFVSGLSTAAKNFTECSAEQADEFAHMVALSITNDPAAMETVRREVFERLTGMIDANPATKEMKLNISKGSGA